jgi:FkbM family methyltransferase
MENFSHQLAARVLRLRNDVVVGRNIDAWRYPPEMPWVPYHDDKQLLHHLDHIINSAALYDAAAALYEDDESREILAQLFCFRALGPGRIKLSASRPEYWENYAIAATWRQGPAVAAAPPFEFSRFRVAFRGHSIELECWLGNVVFTFLADQYFLRRGGVEIQPSAGDYAIDAGGCFGDTALAFAASVGPGGRVVSFEPIPRLRQIFQSNLDRNPELAGRIELYDRAASDVSGRRLQFRDFGAGSRQDEAGPLEVITMSIDDLVEDRALAKVDFIKMDIEGAERSALRGAARTIRRFKPKLAISAYHDPDDLLVLPAMIRGIEPAYRLFLNHYTVHGEESVIYAMV